MSFWLRRNGWRIALALAAVSSVSAATYCVSVEGDDRGAGTAERPFRTIQHAADLAQPGDLVLVGPGIYRERIAPPRGGVEGKPIVYRSRVPHGAIVRGSDVWRPEWRHEAQETWSGVLDEALFTDLSQRDGANPFAVSLSSTPGGRDGWPEQQRGYPNSDPTLVYSLGQVFVDDERFAQVGRAAELGVAPGTWFYDRSTKRLSIHFRDNRPTAHVVEVTTQRRLFAPHRRQLGYLTVEGFVFERCGNQYPTNFWEAAHPEWQQAGAVGTRSGHHWIIRGNVIRQANGIGLDLGNEGDPAADLENGDNGRAENAGHHLVEDNYLLDNGAAGTASYNGVFLTLRGNVVERNNALRFIGKKRWESAGIKLHHPTHSVIEHNLVRDNYGKWGIWLDTGAGEDTQVLANLVIHQGVGIDYEIGLAPPSLCADNVLIDDDIGIGTRESGGVMIANNLVVDAGAAGVSFTIDHLRPGTWSAAHDAVYANVFIGGTGLYQRLTGPDDLRSEDRKLDFNVYAASATEPKFEITGQSPVRWAEWQAIWRKYNGDANADAHSRAVDGLAARFDPLTLELTLTVPDGWTELTCAKDPRLAADYFAVPAAPGRWFPGPFQRLRVGMNRLKLWSGVPEVPEFPRR